MPLDMNEQFDKAREIIDGNRKKKFTQEEIEQQMLANLQMRQELIDQKYQRILYDNPKKG